MTAAARRTCRFSFESPVKTRLKMYPWNDNLYIPESSVTPWLFIRKSRQGPLDFFPDRIITEPILLNRPQLMLRLALWVLLNPWHFRLTDSSWHYSFGNAVHNLLKRYSRNATLYIHESYITLMNFPPNRIITERILVTKGFFPQPHHHRKDTSNSTSHDNACCVLHYDCCWTPGISD